MAEEIKLTLDLDTSKYDRAFAKAQRAADGLKRGLADAGKEAEEAGDKLDKLGKPVEVNIDVNGRAIDQARGDIRAIGSMRVEPTVKPEVDDNEVTTLLDRLKAPILVTVTAVAGAAAVGGFLANEAGQERAGISAFALTTGQSRESAAAVGEIINDVWLTGLAESRAEIGQVAGAFDNAGIEAEELASATEAAFIIAAQSGEDVNDVVRAQIALVKNGLSPTFTDAGNAISIGLGQGLNQGKDFLDTITEYSTVFADLDTDAAGFFTVLQGGLKGGALNTDKVADAFNEVRIRIQTALSAGEGTEFDALQELGLLDEARAFEAGDITGQQFLEGLLGVVEGGDFESLVGVFGTPIEDLGTSVFESIDEALGNPALIATFTGTTERAAAVLEDNIGFAIERAKRVIIDDLTEGFTVGGKPLSDLLDSLPEKLNEFADLVASGAGIPEALEVVLEAPGLAEDIRQLQANLSGFVIELQLAVASFLSAIGQGEGAAALRTGAADAAQAQLVFDLTYLDEEEAGQSLATAIRRGVDDAGIQEALVEAGSNFLDNNALKDFEALLDRLDEGAVVNVEVSRAGTSQSGTFTLEPGESPEEAQARLQAVLDETYATEGEGSFATVTVTAITEFDTEAVITEVQAIGTALDTDATTAVQDFSRVAVNEFFDFETGIDDARVMIGNIPLAAIDANEALVEPVGAMTTQMEGLRDTTREVASAFDDVEAGIAAVLAFVGGGGGSSSTTTTTNNYNVNQNLNASGSADANAAGARFNRDMRGS